MVVVTSLICFILWGLFSFYLENRLSVPGPLLYQPVLNTDDKEFEQTFNEALYSMIMFPYDILFVSYNLLF